MTATANYEGISQPATNPNTAPTTEPNDENRLILIEKKTKQKTWLDWMDVGENTSSKNQSKTRCGVKNIRY